MQAKRGWGNATDTIQKTRRIPVIKRLWGYVIGGKWLLLLALVLTIGSNVLALAGPKLSGNAIDALAGGKGMVDFPTVYYYVLLMLGFYILSSLLSLVLSRLMIRLTQQIVVRLRGDVFEHISRLPVSFFDRHQSGDIISHITYDIDTLAASLSSDVITVSTSVITVVGSLVMMLTICPLLVAVFAVTVPLSMLFTRFMSRKVRPLFRKRSRALGEMNGFVEEMASGLNTIKAYNREEYADERFMSHNSDACQSYYEADYYACMTGPGVNFINNLSLSLISCFGALMFLSGGISLGNLSSFVLYSRKFSGPINETANILSEMQSALAAAERVFRLLDEKEEEKDSEGAEMPEKLRGSVAFDNVSFGYLKSKIVLHNVCLDIPAGSVTAIVGATGAGKTTLVNLLMRFYDPNSGAVLMDERDLRALPRAELRKSYTMVLQDTWLFEGTVINNLRYGKPDASLEEVENACRRARIDSFIRSLPSGYDTVLSEDGANISRGQKQLLCIARAMLGKKKMLILDEATSNVDIRTEKLIQDAMAELMRGKTCFVIAHRLSTIVGADRILVMKDGDVVESGTHAELMKAGGTYSELYRAQFA
ncbi:MAG: ABC transporter ATP-binding protein [Eubacteriales bacterium]|nr:ABC transporter ATP-binding protein [Eubacteriales bacterium]MDD3880635.1 ABC transporter ATP-binding protein [Eubacteriales bacterium]MDD4513541.1 ABC transporter ATP-binding protein [Eubacteriales bacterium]